MGEVIDLQAERAKRLHEARSGDGDEAVVRMPDRTMDFSGLQEPSKSKYRFLLLLAIILDIIDWAELTGVGWFISLLLKTLGFILYEGGKGIDARVKAMEKIQESTKGALMYMQRVAERLMSVSQLARLGRGKGLGGRILRAPARRLFLKLRVAKVRRILKRNPMTKNTLAILIDIIPILDLFPWRTIGIWLAHRDEVKTYKECMEAVAEYKETKKMEYEAKRDYLDSVEEELEEEQEEKEQPQEEQLAA
jgi:hypothetical protein